jgi:hypothetical protein
MKTYPNSPLTSEAAMRVKVMEAKKNQEPAPAAPALSAPPKPSKP